MIWLEIIIATLLSNLGRCATTASFMRDDQLYSLDSLNYDRFTRHSHNAAVFLTRSYNCPECSEAHSIVNRAAEKLHARHGHIKIGYIQCEHNEALCARLTIKKAPALILRVASEHLYFDEIFTYKEVFDFIDGHMSTKPLRFATESVKASLATTRLREKAVAILDGSSSRGVSRLFEDLSRIEVDDDFYICQSSECRHYFDASHNLVFLAEKHAKLVHVNEHTELHDLRMKFSIFKHPFEISFEGEFEKKVIRSTNPAAILITEQRDDRYLDLFETALQDFHRDMLACVIEIGSLSDKGRKLFAKVVEILNLQYTSLPLITYVAPDPHTMRLEQYRYTGEHNVGALEGFFRSAVGGAAQRHVRYEQRHEPVIEGIPVLNGHSFPVWVFEPGRESVILVHKGFEGCKTSKQFLTYMVELNQSEEFRGLQLSLVNGKKNDLPVVLGEMPAVLIFTLDRWKEPIVFTRNKGGFETLVSMIRDRKKYYSTGAEEAGFNVSYEL